jgi:putative ABC transport system permease protein
MLSHLTYALRQLRKKPGFTAIAIVTLALGIGVNTMMFSVLNALILRATGARDADRVVSVFRATPFSKSWPTSPANFYDLRRENTSFQQLAAYDWDNFNLAEPGQPAERLSGLKVTGDFFSVFGVPPELGRTLTPDDDRPGAPTVAVLTDSFWRGHFAADPAIVGRVVRLDGHPVTIVGVMPREMEDPLYWGHTQLWEAAALDGPARAIRNNNWLSMTGRLKPGVSIAAAQSEATAIAARLEHDFPDTNAQSGLRLESFSSARTGAMSRNVSWLCMGLAGFVLLIACANLANLQLARMADRVREHAVRIALGATRMQIIAQLLVESLLLSAAGAGAGILIAQWGTRFIGRGIYIASVPGLDIPINGEVLGFTLLASVVTGMAIGTLPAWIASRTDVNSALKQGSRGSTVDSKRHLFRQGLIVFELALALVLLAGAGFFVRGTQRVLNTDPGWRPDGVIIASLSLPFTDKYQSNAQVQGFFDKFRGKLESIPGVTESTVGTALPITGTWTSASFAVQDRPAPPKGKEPLATDAFIAPGYFATLGIPLVSGRDFTAADRMDTAHVAIVDETLAKAFWPGQSALGKRIGTIDNGKPDWVEIVGVARHVHATLELVQPADTSYQQYRPVSQTPWDNLHWFNVAIRSTAPQATVASALRTAVAQIDSDQPVYNIQSARAAMAGITTTFTLVCDILGAFALIGLILSSIGIYGVIANLVAQRTSEIGIRMALGAQVNDVLWLVLRQGVKLAAVGTGIGLACAWGLTRLLVSLVPSIPGGDLSSIGIITALLAAVAVFACWLPARRATKVDPIIALRGD